MVNAAVYTPVLLLVKLQRLDTLAYLSTSVQNQSVNMKQNKVIFVVSSMYQTNLCSDNSNIQISTFKNITTAWYIIRENKNKYTYTIFLSFCCLRSFLKKIYKLFPCLFLFVFNEDVLDSFIFPKQWAGIFFTMILIKLLDLCTYIGTYINKIYALQVLWNMDKFLKQNIYLSIKLRCMFMNVFHNTLWMYVGVNIFI